MPLSEHEERILAEIERRLSEEDPRFVKRTRRASGRDAVGTRVRAAAAGFVVGLVCLLGLTFHLAFGVVGFGLMFASVIVGVTALRGDDGDLGARLRRAFPRSGADR
jgi:TRAP-type uncharacterized transport system fused permease subunit